MIITSIIALPTNYPPNFYQKLIFVFLSCLRGVDWTPHTCKTILSYSTLSYMYDKSCNLQEVKLHLRKLKCKIYKNKKQKCIAFEEQCLFFCSLKNKFCTFVWFHCKEESRTGSREGFVVVSDFERFDEDKRQRVDTVECRRPVVGFGWEQTHKCQSAAARGAGTVRCGGPWFS